MSANAKDVEASEDIPVRHGVAHIVEEGGVVAVLHNEDYSPAYIGEDREAATTVCDLLNRGEVSEAMRVVKEPTPEDLIRNG